jgi:LmbE family N-acetylglucosaminyl deacetylase
MSEREAGRDLLAGGVAPCTLVVAAHPDDETVGAGAQLARLRQAARVVHLTDGAPRDGTDARAAGFATREAYAAARRAELLSALAEAGVPATAAFCLGYPDQEASLHLAEAARRLGREVVRQRARLVLAPAYEGGHPDHDAAAFAAATACALARRSAPGLVVQLFEYPLYHAGPDGPWQQGFLPGPGPELDIPLAPEQQAVKRRMLDCFASQRHVLERFPCDRERFRRAPARDFTRPPHEGRLQYEGFPWGMTGERFRALAAGALRELGLAPREAAWP